VQQQLKKQKPIQQKNPQNEEEDLWSDIRNLRLIKHHLNGHQSQFLLPSSTITTASQQWPVQFCHDKTTEQNKTKHLTDSFPPRRGTENNHCTKRPETLLLLLLLPVQSSKLQEHHREGSIQSKRSITAQ
jgi:hypothetical protein